MPLGFKQLLAELDVWKAPDLARKEEPKAEDKIPDLTVNSDPKYQCGSCEFFSLKLGKAWFGQGRCVKFRVDVQSNNLCPEFKPIYDSDSVD